MNDESKPTWRDHNKATALKHGIPIVVRIPPQPYTCVDTDNPFRAVHIDSLCTFVVGANSNRQLPAYDSPGMLFPVGSFPRRADSLGVDHLLRAGQVAAKWFKMTESNYFSRVFLQIIPGDDLKRSRDGSLYLRSGGLWISFMDLRAVGLIGADWGHFHEFGLYPQFELPVAKKMRQLRLHQPKPAKRKLESWQRRVNRVTTGLFGFPVYT